MTSTTAKKFLKLYPDVFRLNGDGYLFCIKCRTVVNSSRKFLIIQHLKTLKHQNSQKPSKLSDLNEASDEKKDVQQQLWEKKSFQDQLTDTFIKMRIPLFKLKDSRLSELFKANNLDVNVEEVTGQMVDKLLNEKIQEIRPKIANNDVFITIYLMHVLDSMDYLLFFIGNLNNPNESYLFEIAQMSESINYETTIVRTINNSIFKMNINSENILLLLTNMDESMLKTGKYLKILYPKLHHITCGRDLIKKHLVLIKGHYKNINKLIYIRDDSQEELLRWLDTVDMYAGDTDSLMNIIKDATIIKDIHEIKRNYFQFKIITRALQAQNITIHESVKILNKIEFFDDPVGVRELLRNQIEKEIDLMNIVNHMNMDISKEQYKSIENCYATMAAYSQKDEDAQRSIGMEMEGQQQLASNEDVRYFLIHYFSQNYKLIPETGQGTSSNLITA